MPTMPKVKPKTYTAAQVRKELRKMIRDWKLVHCNCPSTCMSCGKYIAVIESVIRRFGGKTK